MFNLKRKHDNGEAGDDAEAQANFIKRRRRRPIESGLAALSLSSNSTSTGLSLSSPVHIASHNGQIPSQQSLPSPPSSAPIVQVSEKLSSASDVHMKSSSWYEPEKDRIVILDLDASSDSGDEGSSTQIDAEDLNLMISPALLSKLKQIPRVVEPVKETPELALVLFKPPIWQTPSGIPSPETNMATITSSTAQPPTDVIPMELDP